MSELTPPVGPRDHIRGNENAPVTLLEYGDYECPFCGLAESNVRLVRNAMGNRLRFAFRNFPLTRIHPHALQAAFAAESAGLQNSFWEMHDLLYKHQDALEDEDLVGYAVALGLDTDQFVTELGSDRIASRVREDLMSGVRSGVNGTPTFYINGRRHEGSYEYEVLLAAIERAAEESL